MPYLSFSETFLKFCSDIIVIILSILGIDKKGIDKIFKIILFYQHPDKGGNLKLFQIFNNQKAEIPQILLNEDLRKKVYHIINDSIQLDKMRHQMNEIIKENKKLIDRCQYLEMKYKNNCSKKLFPLRNGRMYTSKNPIHGTIPCKHGYKCKNPNCNYGHYCIPRKFRNNR